jgi:hypothetical protein
MNMDNMSTNSITIFSFFAKVAMYFFSSKPSNSHHSSNAFLANFLLKIEKEEKAREKNLNEKA